ncbi:unnamed protein product [Prunus armeniaca]
MAKDKIVEAQDAIREKNTMLLQKAALAREVEELKRLRAEEVAAARGEMEQKKAEKIADVRAEAIESFRGSEELRNYIMDQLVAMQLCWE